MCHINGNDVFRVSGNNQLMGTPDDARHLRSTVSTRLFRTDIPHEMVGRFTESHVGSERRSDCRLIFLAMGNDYRPVGWSVYRRILVDKVGSTLYESGSILFPIIYADHGIEFHHITPYDLLHMLCYLPTNLWIAFEKEY